MENNDLISRAALLEEYDRVHVGPPGGARKLMENAPAIDAELVRHGVWLPVELEKSFGTIHGVKCSLCDYEGVRKELNYCPNCGAKMDGEARKNVYKFKRLRFKLYKSCK